MATILRRMTWLWFGLGFYLLFVALLYGCQRQLLYYPSKEDPDPARAGLPGLEVVEVAGGDGLTLRHWLVPPPDADAPLVVVFHGNAGHHGHRADKYRFLVEAGAGLLLAGYRGYGGNPGVPEEAGMTADASALLDRLAGRGLAPARTWLYGESLGSGLAVKLAAAAETPLAGVILEAPYSSIAEVAQSHYWYVPAKWLVKDRWDSIGRIAQIRAPLLILHGERDNTVPTRFGRKLFDAAAEPKAALWLPRAGHNDVLDFPEARERVLRFVRGGHK